MKKIYEIISKKQKRGDVGIEIETEGKGLKIVDNEIWYSEDDGSLRGRFPESRCEYVLRNPIPTSAVWDAVYNLQEALDGSEISFSFRTSVHVHVNVQQLTMQEVINMIYIYMLIEEPLINFCGQSRIGNRFCLRIRDAEQLVGVFRKMLDIEKKDDNSGKSLQLLNPDALRYAAINIAALTKYGSIEFRGMEGNIDPDLISTWATVLTHIRDFGKNFKSLNEISEYFLEQDPCDFFYAAVGPENAHYFFPGEYKTDMMLNHSITCDLLHT